MSRSRETAPTLEAIKYDQAARTLEVLDQLLLPHTFRYVAVETLADAHSVISRMQVRGAPAIALVACFSLALEYVRRCATAEGLPAWADLLADLQRDADYLLTSRPTAVNLLDMSQDLAKHMAALAGAEPAAFGAELEKFAVAYFQEDRDMNERIGRHGVAFFEEHHGWAAPVPGPAAPLPGAAAAPATGRPFLTHCNTGSLATSGFGTALGVMRALHASKHLAHLYFTETRPFFQGARLTGCEVALSGLPHTLICDNMAGFLFSKVSDFGGIVVGCDRVARNGDVANKVGTYQLAVLARAHGIPFVVAGPHTSFDFSLASGDDIPIEVRAPAEVTTVKGRLLSVDGGAPVGEDVTLATVQVAMPGVGVWNPGFDITPHRLISAFVTPDGVFKPNEQGEFDFSALMAKHGRA